MIFGIAYYGMEPSDTEPKLISNTEFQMPQYKTEFENEVQDTLPKGSVLIDVRKWIPPTFTSEYNYNLMIQLTPDNLSGFVADFKPFGKSLCATKMPEMLSISGMECGKPDTPYKWICDADENSFLTATEQTAVDRYLHVIFNQNNGQLLLHIYKF